jgi:hypothetical protein
LADAEPYSIAQISPVALALDMNQVQTVKIRIRKMTSRALVQEMATAGIPIEIS